MVFKFVEQKLNIMPRNIEYLLEQYLNEGNLPQFILTCAIDYGFYPPEYILQKYGGRYGFDNFILTNDELIKLKSSLESQLRDIRNSPQIDEKEILAEIENNYSTENKKYCWLLNDYSQEIDKIENMEIRIGRIVPSDEPEKIFLDTIKKYFELKRKDIKEQYEAILKEPIMESIENAKYRLSGGKIKELEASIKDVEIKLLFDEKFFIKISNNWLK